MTATLASTVVGVVRAMLRRRPRRNPMIDRRTIDYDELRALLSADASCDE